VGCGFRVRSGWASTLGVVTNPNLFSPQGPPALEPPPPERPHRSRRRRGVIVAALVLLVLGGTAIALLIPALRSPAPVGLPAAGARPAPAPVGPPAKGARDAQPGGLLGVGGGKGSGGGIGDDTLVVGSVASTSAGSIVVTSDSGGDRTIRTDGTTRVRGGARAAVGDLKPGERVVVRVHGTGDAATAVMIATPKARVTGTVTQLSGDTATIRQVDGTTGTADVAAVNPKPAVGDLVVVSGKATDGAALVADQLRVLPRTP
jgi:hypothetical protein